MPDVLLPRIRSQKLVEQTADLLRSKILDGAFGADGELPTQGDLCRELGVSRSVIREAMQQLQSQRLLTVSQGKRPRVMPPGEGAMAEALSHWVRREDVSLTDLSEVRLSLETVIAALAAERGNAADHKRLEAAIVAMETCESIAEQIDADVAFHRVLAEAAGNPVFVFLLDGLAPLLRASREHTIGLGGVSPAVIGHRDVLSAVVQGNADAARCAMRHHLEAATRDLAESRSGD